jgi:antitoxin MazE
MKARIVRIGNSRGVRIPKPLLEQTGIGGEVEISVQGSNLIISPVHPRSGWADAFVSMAASGDDKVLDITDSQTSSWDDEEWEW